MSEYEKYVINLIKFKVGEYDDRQDYLAALVRATDKWLERHDEKGNIFDGWDDELATWLGEAVRAMNAKKDLPDFPDLELGEENSIPEEAEEDEFENEAVIEDPLLTDGSGGAAATEDEEVVDAEAVLQGGGDTPETVQPETPKPKYRGKTVTHLDNVTHKNRDRYGIIVGTKTHEAVKLYERGTTATELMSKLGGRHYNVIKKLEKDGHKVLKLPGHTWKLIHKDDAKEPE